MRRILIAMLAMFVFAAPAIAVDKPKAVPAETVVTPSFTREEAQVLVNLINIAVMAKGLDAAQAGAVLSTRIIEASKAADKK